MTIEIVLRIMGVLINIKSLYVMAGMFFGSLLMNHWTGYRHVYQLVDAWIITFFSTILGL